MLAPTSHLDCCPATAWRALSAASAQLPRGQRRPLIQKPSRMSCPTLSRFPPRARPQRRSTRKGPERPAHCGAPKFRARPVTTGGQFPGGHRPRTLLRTVRRRRPPPRSFAQVGLSASPSGTWSQIAELMSTAILWSTTASAKLEIPTPMRMVATNLVTYTTGPHRWPGEAVAHQNRKANTTKRRPLSSTFGRRRTRRKRSPNRGRGRPLGRLLEIEAMLDGRDEGA